MLVLHDDARREYAYGPAQGLPASKVGTFPPALYSQATEAGLDGDQHEERLEARSSRSSDARRRMAVGGDSEDELLSRIPDPMKISMTNLFAALVAGGAVALGLASPALGAGARQEAQHPLHRVRRHRLRRPRSLRRRRGPRHADAQHRPPGERGHDVLLVLRPAELHAGPRRDADRPHPEPQRHDHRGLPGPGRRPAGGGMDARLGAEDRAATRPTSPASGTSARPTTRCRTRRATTR